MSEHNPPLRYRALWLVIGYFLIGLIIFLSLTSTPPKIGPEIPYIDKFFHAFAYFVVMSWFVQIYHIKMQYSFWALFLILLGILLEYLQSFDPAREGGVSDAIANTVGVVLGLSLVMTALKHTLAKFEKLL